MIQELKDKGVKQFAIYHSLNNRKYFEKYYNPSGEQVVKLLSLDSLKKKGQSEIILESIERFFQSRLSDKLSLIEVIKYVIKDTSIKSPTIYKIISQNPHELLKSEVNGTVWLSYKSQKFNLESKKPSEWTEIKDALNREIEEIFKDTRQPVYNVSLLEILELFKKIIDYQTPENDLNGLGEQLWKTLYKFYHSANDRNDILNAFKQLSTSLDPFLQKILYLIDTSKYLTLKSKKSGLGSFIKELNKLDDKEFRYKNHIKDVPIFKFSKHMFAAYNSRNQITHLAKKWSKRDLIDNFTSTLVVFVFATFEYQNELEKAIKI